MIYVTQGHERGIGLEIFLKSFLLLSTHERAQITLISNQTDLDENRDLLHLKKDLFKNLNVIEPESSETLPSSTASLLKALDIIATKDILVTLPTSKDQLIYKGKSLAGYTEFFREFYNKKNISMTFKGIDQDVLLITDHIPLKSVASSINSQLIIDKVETTLNFYKKYFYSFDEVIFAGINPHAGENGILGLEDKCILEAKTFLENKSSISFIGPVSGDTLHTLHKPSRKQLFVYMFHDQGLAPFKSKFGFIGLNISMGLPFLRLSVDHGTAFGLHGKNMGDISGMLYLLKTAFGVIHNVNQRN